MNNNNNNRTHLVELSFSGKTYFMLEIFSRIPDRDIYIINKSPPEHYTESKIKIKEMGEKIKPLNAYENAIIVFDDFLGSNSRYVDQFFIRGRHNNLDISYLSQSLFDLRKRTIRTKSSKIFLFNQTLKDIENLYRDVGGYDMSYDVYKRLCRETRKEEFNYFCIDKSKMRDQGRIVFVTKVKTHIQIACVKQNFFD